MLGMYHCVAAPLFVLLFVKHPCHGASLSDIHFSEDFSSLYPPSTEYGPIDVDIRLNLHNIFEVNEISSYVVLDIVIYMTWKDPRITIKRNSSSWCHDFLSFNGPTSKEAFWIPDIYIDGAIKSRVPTYYMEPYIIRYYKDSSILLMSRLNFDAFCQMNFRKYPNDIQRCHIRLVSWDSPTDQIKLSWDSARSLINPNISLESFDSFIDFQSYDNRYGKKTYSGLTIRIILHRRLQYHLIETFLPSILCVVLGWMSMLLDAEAIPGRVKMLMLTLLTTLGMFNSVRESTPQVSYVSYLDIWMVMCILFIFSILIEFSMVLWMIRQGRKKSAKTLETLWLILFPLIFITFLLIFWCSILYQDTEE